MQTHLFSLSLIYKVLILRAIELHFCPKAIKKQLATVFALVDMFLHDSEHMRCSLIWINQAAVNTH